MGGDLQPYGERMAAGEAMSDMEYMDWMDQVGRMVSYLVKTKYPGMHTYVDDITGHVIMRLWGRRSSYKKEKAQYATWMSMVIINVIRSMYASVDAHHRSHLMDHDSILMMEEMGVAEERDRSYVPDIDELTWIEGNIPEYLTELGYPEHVVEQIVKQIAGPGRTPKSRVKLNLKWILVNAGMREPEPRKRGAKQ